MVAWIVTRTDTPLRGLGYFTAFASFGTPFILYTIGWLLLLGKAGPVNYWLRMLLNQSGPVRERLFSVGNGVRRIFALVAVCVSDAGRFLPLHGSVARRGLGGLRRAALADACRRVSLRLMLPAFFSVILLIFIRSFESFEIPALVGLPGDIRVLTTSIYLDSQRMPPTYGRAGAFSVLLMLVGGGTLYVYFRVTREGDKFHTITGKGYRPTVIQLGGWRYVTAALLLLYSFVLLVLPFLIVLWASLLPFYIQPSLEAFSLFTLKNYVTAIHFPKITDSIKNSVLLGLGSATCGDAADHVRFLDPRPHQVARPLAAGFADDLAAVVSRYRHGLGDHAVLSDRADSHLRYALDFAGRLHHALHSLRHSLHPFRPACSSIANWRRPLMLPGRRGQMPCGASRCHC